MESARKIGAAMILMMTFCRRVLPTHSLTVPRRILRSSSGPPGRMFLSTELQGGAPSNNKSARARKRGQNKLLVEEEGSSAASSSSSSSLEWETFEFSTSPKWDQRFDDNALHIASNTESWKDIEDREAQEDVALREKFERMHRQWESLDLELIDQATQLLLPYIQPERWNRIQEVTSKRTQQTRFLFENPANPSNVWACLRTLDSFGIQHVDVVIQSGRYQGKAALTQKRGMRTAMGSAKWLTLKNHLSTTHALQHLKDEGYHILCTDVNPESKDIRDVDWDASGKKICIIMGNEQYGVSDQVKALADESFYLPMVGMAESFNLSVATAITCAHLSAASIGQEPVVEAVDGDNHQPTTSTITSTPKGPLRAGDLSEHECKTLLLKGALNTVKHKVAQALFRQHGLEFPKDFNLS